jgi:hypothetical protein
VIAGGGGAPSGDFSGLSAVTATCGTFDVNSGPATCNGDGGITFTGNSGGAGGGFFTDGAGNTTVANGGKAYINGGEGALTTNIYARGGFGGGGGNASPAGSTYAASGGGGFSGGNGGNRSVQREGGGGGGSYNSGINQVNSVLTTTGHGMVIITKLCNLSLSAATNPVCEGDQVMLNTNALNVINWSEGSSTSNTIFVTPTITTTYSVTGIGTPNSCTSTAILQVSVMPLPVVSAIVSPPLICAGSAATLTGMGADTYTWSSGPTGSVTTVSPPISTIYSVTGTNNLGCSNSGTVMVNVNSNSISVSLNPTICIGNSANLSATGAINYTWSTGAPISGILVSPNITTTYTVVGIDANFCMLSNMVTVLVNPLPNVLLNASQPNICKGESVDLTAMGANTYVWSTGATSASITVTPLVDVPYTYSVTGTDNNNCSNSASVTIYVDKCTGLQERGGVTRILVYPNPTSGIALVQLSRGAIQLLELSDISGRVIIRPSTNDSSGQIDLSGLSNGIYYLKVRSETVSEVIKIVKQ